MPVASDLYYYTFQGGDLDSLPVVLLHGAGGSHLYWPPEIRRLAGVRVFAPDLPGHAKSVGRGQQSIDAYAKLITGWLEGLGISRAVFIGHSMGSAIALTLAINYPQQVAGLGLIGAGARMRVRQDILADCANPTTFHKAIESLIMGAFSRFADARLVELAASRMAETRPSVLHGDLLACHEFDPTEKLGEIRVSTLVLCGSEDLLTPLRSSQFLAGAIPIAALKVIPEAGHMVMLEKPKEVASALQDYLATLPRSRAGD
jgi:pimeloyl-ACP methyl ester carboxylesterase